MTKKIHGRHGARIVAVQGFYAWQLAGLSLRQIEEDLLVGDFYRDPENKENRIKISFDKEYLHELLHTIGGAVGTLNALIAPHSDRALEEIHPIELAILWVALYELKDRIEIPYKVIINEAILVAKEFGAQDSHKFINGILDKAARVVRQREALPA